MTAGYGDGPDIISSCSITANRGEIVAILGPNGAGKSTAMKAMLGLLKLKSGSVTLNGEDISNINPQDRVKKGISFVPQTRNVFAELTVRENLEIGGFLTEGSLENKIESIYSLFPILSEKKSQVVGQLSGGQRQQVALGRALMSDPSVLMLDEPTAGVSPIVMDEFNSVTGLVTIEDLVEEIVGEIEDEHDKDEAPMFRQKNNNIIMDAAMLVDDFEREFDVNIPDDLKEDVGTIGGIIFNIAGRIPKKKEKFTINKKLSFFEGGHQLEKLEFALAIAQTKGDEKKSIVLRKKIVELGGNVEEPGT